MANLCFFKGIVKGKKKNCDKFLEVFPCNEVKVTKEIGDDNNHQINFEGNCNYDICVYASNRDKVDKLTSEQIDSINNNSIDEFVKYRLEDLAVLFNLEIMLNSVDEEFIEFIYFHFISDKKIEDEMPVELDITEEEVYDDEYDV